RIRRAPRERVAGRVGRRRRHVVPRAGRGRERGDGRVGRQSLCALHALRQSRGLSLHVHRHDGHHGGRRWERHPGRPTHRRRAVHGSPRSPARGHVVAVAAARLRSHSRLARVLPAAWDRAHVFPLTLSVRDLTVRFGGVAALGGVSFDVEPGSITSLIGPNGAGKTTAFNAITGYLRAARGRVSYGNVVLTGLRPCDIARRGAVRTFQKTSVFPALSVLDNVLTGLHLRGHAGVWAVLAGRRRVHEEEAALRAEAETIVAFVGLAHRRAEIASALPYGEQRLVGPACAPAPRPPSLLLDQPPPRLTGALEE